MLLSSDSAVCEAGRQPLFGTKRLAVKAKMSTPPLHYNIYNLLFWCALGWWLVKHLSTDFPGITAVVCLTISTYMKFDRYNNSHLASTGVWQCTHCGT